MRWQNHIIIGGAFGAVINPMIVPVAMLGSTAPDWIEYILKVFGKKVKHRGVARGFMPIKRKRKRRLLCH